MGRPDVDCSTPRRPLGYCVAPEDPKAPIELGDIVLDLSGQKSSVLLRLSTTNQPKIQNSHQSFGFENTDNQRRQGLLGSLRLTRTITRTSYAIQNLELSEIILNSEFYAKNQERIKNAIKAAGRKQAFLVYGLATAGVLRFNQSSFERFGFSTKLGAMHLGYSTQSTASTKYTQHDSVVGYRVLRLRLKDDKIQVENYVVSPCF